MKVTPGSLAAIGLIIFASVVVLPATLKAEGAAECAKHGDDTERSRCVRFKLASDLFNACMSTGRNLASFNPKEFQGVLTEVKNQDGEQRFQNTNLGVMFRIEKQQCWVFARADRRIDLIKLFEPIEESIRKKYPDAALRQREDGVTWLEFKPEENDRRYVTVGNQLVSGQNFVQLIYQVQ